MLPFAVNDSLGETNINIASRLIEVSFLRSLEAPRILEDHIGNTAYIPEVDAVASYPIDADIADHQHAQLTLAFGLCAHQAGEHLDLLGIGLYDCHIASSHSLSKGS